MSTASTSPTGALKSPRSASCTLVEQQPAASLAALDRAHPDACRVDGLQPIQVMQRPLLRQTFTIVAHRSDGYLAGEGEPFRVSFRGPAASHPSLSDNRDGTYTCEWTAPVSGDYLVNVTLRSVPICGSPFSVRVVENGASALEGGLGAGDLPLEGALDRGFRNACTATQAHRRWRRREGSRCRRGCHHGHER